MLALAALATHMESGAARRGAALRDKVPIIIDTDMSIDVDDVGMLCAAHALQDNGEASILAVVHDTGAPAGAGAISVINHYYGRDNIPIGAYRGKIGAPSGCPKSTEEKPEPECDGWRDDNPYEHWTNDAQGVYIDELVRMFPSPIRSADDVPDALTTYRQQLAAASEQSVVIVSVGFTTNLLDLIRSPPDSISTLTGTELVKSRVKKLVLMGGRHDPQSWDPPEWNLAGCGSGCGHFDDLPDLSENTFNEWPNKVPIEMIGFEIGVEVHTGNTTGGTFQLSEKYLRSPCRYAYTIFCARMDGWCEDGKGRASWDPMALVYAVRGVENMYELEKGKIIVDPVKGTNEWQVREEDSGCEDDGDDNEESCKNHAYLKSLVPRSTIEWSINELIQQEPINGGYYPSPPPPITRASPPSPSPPPLARTATSQTDADAGDGSDRTFDAGTPPSPSAQHAPISARIIDHLMKMGGAQSGKSGWAPSSFSESLALAILSLVCWGTWSNTSKAAR
jgi:inosine-uridine nucleoside N-ribohydrolase